MIRRIARRLWIAFFLSVVIAFLATCLSPFLNPAQWWFFGFLGLLFPYFLILMLFFLFYWAIRRSRWAFLVLACMIVGWRSIYAAFAVNIPVDFDLEKQPDAIRVMTWNIRYFIGPDQKVMTNGISSSHQKTFDLIETYSPDILAMQEFATGDSKQPQGNLKVMETELGFKYHYFSAIGGNAKGDKKKMERGIAIFSKFPIVNSQTIDLPYGQGTTESVIYVDVVANGDTVRVFAGHLQSFGFMRKDYENIYKIKNDPDERLDASKSVARKMRTAFQYRGKQADHILHETEGSQHPEIFCADLNDVPNSYTYFTIKGSKRDAFIERGFGFGKTFFSLHSGFMRQLPALRIDYILTDRQFSVLQTVRVKKTISDHIPLVTDISLNK